MSYAFDLFGEMPVTVAEIDDWLRTVPRLDPFSPRAPHYVRGYNVAAKVRRAKIEDTFDAMIDQGRDRHDRHWTEREP